MYNANTFFINIESANQAAKREDESAQFKIGILARDYKLKY